MAKGRGYAIEMREKHIKRKKWIANHCYGLEWYGDDGRYSKNKVHCSCCTCSPKTRNKGQRRRGNYWPSLNYKWSEKRKLSKMDDDLIENLDLLQNFVIIDIEK